MKQFYLIFFFFSFSFFFLSVNSDEIHYVVNFIHQSCSDSCSKANYLCSDKKLKEMNCRHAAMSYCGIYLQPYDVSQISYEVFGCVFDCEKMSYYNGEVRTCDYHLTEMERHVPNEQELTDYLCECYTETTSTQLFTLPIRIGIILFLTSGIIIISFIIYQKIYSIRYLYLHLTFLYLTSFIILFDFSNFISLIFSFKQTTK